MQSPQEKLQPCALCGRPTPPEYLEEHHLIPRSKGGSETIAVCCNCGDQVHRLFDNHTLATSLNTLEKLRAHPSMQKWIRWVRRRKSFHFSMKRKKRR